jgi:aryl carrier-like protein
MMKNLIQKILKEETDLDQDGNDIAVGLSHKAMNHLTDALRAIESALQYATDDDLKDGLEDIRMSLLSSEGRQEGFAAEHESEYDNIINVMGDLIADNSEDIYNFNLSGPGPKAPEGEF